MFVEMLVTGEGDAETIAGADGTGHLVFGASVTFELFFDEKKVCKSVRTKVNFFSSNELPLFQ